MENPLKYQYKIEQNLVLLSQWESMTIWKLKLYSVLEQLHEIYKSLGTLYQAQG